MEGKQVFFFQEESGRTFLSLRKRHRGLVLDWWVFQFLAVQISFPWTPHLLLKSSRALAFLLFSLITLLGGGGHILFLHYKWECGIACIREDPVRGQCYQEEFGRSERMSR